MNSSLLGSLMVALIIAFIVIMFKRLIVKAYQNIQYSRRLRKHIKQNLRTDMDICFNGGEPIEIVDKEPH